jgi:hypothetical protein
LSSQPSNPALESIAPNFDLIRMPGIGPFLRWRHSRTILQVPLLILSVVMVLHGLFGPAFAPTNLATALTWVQFRGLLVLVILCAGNFFCLECPFMLVRNAARKLAAEFDRQELWRVHLIVQSAEGAEETTTQVEVNPPGYGRWDLLLYALPFLAGAFLWFRSITRSRRKKQMAGNAPQRPAPSQ